MEHIEEAGIHSGDSACVLPPQTISKKIESEIIRQTKIIAKELNVKVDAVEVVSVDLLIVWPFKFKGSPFNFSATILFLLTYFAEDGLIKYSSKSIIFGSTSYKALNKIRKDSSVPFDS